VNKAQKLLHRVGEIAGDPKDMYLGTPFYAAIMRSWRAYLRKNSGNPKVPYLETDVMGRDQGMGTMRFDMEGGVDPKWFAKEFVNKNIPKKFIQTIIVGRYDVLLKLKQNPAVAKVSKEMQDRDPYA